MPVVFIRVLGKAVVIVFWLQKLVGQGLQLPLAFLSMVVLMTLAIIAIAREDPDGP